MLASIHIKSYSRFESTPIFCQFVKGKILYEICRSSQSKSLFKRQNPAAFHFHINILKQQSYDTGMWSHVMMCMSLSHKPHTAKIATARSFCVKWTIAPHLTPQNWLMINILIFEMLCPETSQICSNLVNTRMSYY